MGQRIKERAGGLSGQSDCLTTSSLSDPKRGRKKECKTGRSVGRPECNGEWRPKRPFFVRPQSNNAESPDQASRMS